MHQEFMKAPPSSTRHLCHSATRLGLLMGLLGILISCSTPSATNQEMLAQQAAQKYNQQGVAAKDPEAAMKLFRQAVAADPLYGPAQNNLGIALLKQHDYYDSAKAFEQASRLMPDNPQPRIYLGLVYESAGQLSNAQKQLEQVLIVSPDNIETIQALARVRVKQDELDAQTVSFLKTISMRGTDDAWRKWAQTQLIRITGG